MAIGTLHIYRKYMFNAKAYSAASATSPLAPTVIARRDPSENDVQIEILFCGICHSDLHYARNQWSEVMQAVYARYKKLSAPEEILDETDDEEWRIQFRWTLAVEVEPQILIEHCFAWVLTIARHGSGTRISPLRVELVQPRPHQKALERYFGCPVVCGQSRNVMVFRASDAALPFVTRNAELLDMLAPQFEQDLKQHTSGESSFLELFAWCDPAEAHGPSSEDRGRSARAARELAHAATSTAGIRIELSTRAR